MEGRHDCGRPRQGIAGARRDECARAGGSLRAIARSSSFRRARAVPPGAEPRYKYGVMHLYAETGVPCLPIALNSGLFWPRRSIRRNPGTIRVEVLEPIPAGLDKEAFFARLQQSIEPATARLVAEGERELAKNGVDARRSRRHRDGGTECVSMHAPEPLGEQVQLGLAIAELLQRGDRLDHVVAVGAGLAVALAHMMQLLLQREATGILHVAAVDYVAERRAPAAPARS